MNFKEPTPLSIISPSNCAAVLRQLLDRRELWEKRFDRTVSYRNGEWYTLGSPLYLDLPSAEAHPDFIKKVGYFNWALLEFFELFLAEVKHELNTSLKLPIKYLALEYGGISFPGFHIFPGFETFGAFFGKRHRDLQWKTLPLLPNFPFKEDEMTGHFSFTIPLRLPYLGGSLRLYNETDFINFPYEVGTIYTHSGEQEHAIAPFQSPVLPGDWRITFQGHGFNYKGEIYLYW